MPRVKRIDPRGCGCLDCTGGESVSLDLAKPDDIFSLLVGHADNRTGWPLNEVLDHVRPDVRDTMHWIALHDFIGRYNPSADIFRSE